MLQASVSRVEGDGLSESLEPHRKRLWRICYRMTGVSADADELVQETFVRVLVSPPADRARDLGPWLTRVAINAAHDRLRRRKSEPYLGPWLPSALELEAVIDDGPSPSARYSERESLSYAFMLAIEALTPVQRAIVVLRDVLDYSVSETASALSLTEANVKTTHHRTRALLASYDAEPARFDEASRARSRAAMASFFGLLALNDVAGLERRLSADVVAFNDGADEFFAAKRPVLTPHRVARLFFRLSKKSRVIGVTVCELSGLSAIVLRQVGYMPGIAPLTVNLFEANALGQITRIYSLLTTRKLSGLTVIG